MWLFEKLKRQTFVDFAIYLPERTTFVPWVSEGCFPGGDWGIFPKYSQGGSKVVKFAFPTQN